MNGKLYIKKFIRDDGETLSFDAEEIYLSENNTLLVRSDPATTAVEFTEEDGGEMIRQRGATYSQPVSGLIVPKSTEYWALCVRLSRFFILNHTYKIVYIKKDSSMFSVNRAWINTGLQIVPVPYENYSTWTIEFRIGDNFWTEYAEDSQGKEIYSNSIELPLLTAGTGGEVWSDVTQQTLSGLGNYFTIDGTSISASINELEVRGDTYQQTYSGANLFNVDDSVNVGAGTTVSSDGFISQSHDNSSGSASYFMNYFTNNLDLQTSTQYTAVLEVKSVSGSGSVVVANNNAQSQSADQKEYDFSSLHAGDIIATQFTTKSSFSAAIYGIRGYSRYAAGDSGSITYRISVLADTSVTPETFVYQPYVGGIASPNPDYPQDIQVVTGEQTVTVTGKNLFSTQGSTNQSVVTGLNSIYLEKPDIRTCQLNMVLSLPAGTYTLSYDVSKNATNTEGVRCGVYGYDSGNVSFGGAAVYDGHIEYTFNATVPIHHLYFFINNNMPDGSAVNVTNIQIETGSATAFEPYQSQSYTISLGSTELCKIGDYQDYIYKSGDDWYLHKEVGKYVFDGEEEWYSGTYGTNSWVLDDVIRTSFDTTKTQVISNLFRGIPHDDRTIAGDNTIYFGSNVRLWIRDTSLATLTNVQSTTNGNYVYYALATATDTQITDATLVAQLDALAGAQAYNGKTVYQTNSATMPAILSVELLQSVGGGETWDNVGAVWEEGVGGVQTINVETTQTTYPVWTVTGPCSNPTLQNDTTDTIASFDGMIASGQTLTVNFADNTAYLDSAPVAKYVSGYVSLAPGENVIGFNSDGGSTQTSTISWDNIIN